MAEERLIDDDKDKKYKIRKNAEGVDELYIDGEPEEELTFEIPEFETDDEEAAVMTPEQLAAREKMREDEERRRVEKIADLIQKAERALEEGDYDSARYHLAEAAETDGKNGEIRFLQLKALTQNFTDFTLASDAAEVAESVKAYCTPEQKSALKEISAPLSERLSQTEKELETLGEENETKKAERRAVFKQKRKKALIAFAATGVPLVIFAIAAAIMGSIMHSRKDGVLVIVTIVLAALALVALIATLFTAHNFWKTSQKVSRNENNANTRLGREYEAKKVEFNALTAIFSALNTEETTATE